MSSIPEKNREILAKPITGNGVYAKYLKSLDSASSIQKWAQSINGSGAYAEYLKSLDNTSSIQKWAKSISGSGAYAEYLRNLDNTSSIQKWAKSISGSGAYAEYLRSLDSTSSIQKWAKSINGNSTYAEYLKSLGSTNSEQKWAKSITNNSAFYESLERLLSQSKYLDNLFADVEKRLSDQNAYFDNSTADFVEHDAIDLLQELASEENPSDVGRILGKFPDWLKWLLVNFLVSLVWPLLIGAASGVMGNLITPYVQAYLDETQSTTQREQLKGLQKLSFSELGIELRGYRFITATALHLRATPNARAPIVGEVKFGQVVSVLSSSLDWTEVLYEYGDGSTVTGWVFTRYTAKFRG